MSGSTSRRLSKWVETQQRKESANVQRIAAETVGEFRKHPWATVGLIALCLFSYPVATVQFLLLLVLIWAAFKFAAFGWWARQWRAALTAAERDIPPVRELWSTYTKAKDQQQRLVEKWPQLCIMNGLTAAKRTPLLYDVKPTLDLDFTARIPRTGFDPDDIKAKAPKLAKGLGCQSVVVRETAPGMADVRFNWTDPLRRELPLRELPMAPKGKLAFGVEASGDPISLDLDMSALFIGSPRSGKSNAEDAVFCSGVGVGEYLNIYVSNPKVNEMQEFKRYLSQQMGRVKVVMYAETAKDNVAMIAQFEKDMMERNRAMKGKKLTKSTAEYPRCILWMDELLLLPKSVYKDTAADFSPLRRILAGGPAAMFTVIAGTQLVYSEDLGAVKGLFTQRVVFRLPSPEITETAFFKGAVAQGAACHLLHKTRDRGVGWALNDDGELVQFRAAKVEDSDLADALRGVVPDGMATQTVAELKRCAVYRIWGFADAEGRRELKYVGKSNAPLRRRQEHIDDPAEPWWSTIEDPLNECDPETFAWDWYDTEVLALAAEKSTIQGEGPTKNTVHNRANPMRHARQARDWVARNSRQLTARKSSLEPSSDELADRDAESLPGVDYTGLVSSAAWAE